MITTILTACVFAGSPTPSGPIAVPGTPRSTRARQAAEGAGATAGDAHHRLIVDLFKIYQTPVSELSSVLGRQRGTVVDASKAAWMVFAPKWSKRVVVRSYDGKSVSMIGVQPDAKADMWTDWPAILESFGFDAHTRRVDGKWQYTNPIFVNWASGSNRWVEFDGVQVGGVRLRSRQLDAEPMSREATPNVGTGRANAVIWAEDSFYGFQHMLFLWSWA